MATPLRQGPTVNSYKVTIPSSRSQLPAAVGWLAAQIEALGEADTLHLQIAEAVVSGEVFSKLVLSGKTRPELGAVTPSHS